MTHIAVAHHDLSRKGGAEGVSVNVLEALQDAYSVTLLTLTRPDFDELNSYYNVAVDPDEITVRRVGPVAPAVHRLLGQRLHLFRIGLFAREVRQRAANFDAVLSTYNELSLGRRSLQYVHMPQFGRWTSIGESGPTLTGYDLACRRLSGFEYDDVRSNVLVANSEWTADRVEEVYGTRPHVIYPPVDTTGFFQTPWTDREAGFVAVGRIAPKKHVLELIDIVSSVRERGHDVHLHLVGPVPETTYGERVAREAAAREFVRLEGAVDRSRLIELVCTHRYGIHGMPAEHFGMAVAELVAGGTIPFVPDGGGQREIVCENPTLLYDTPTDAVDKIDRVLSNEAIQRELRADVGGIAERFGRDRFRDAIRTQVDALLTTEGLGTEREDEPEPG